MPPSGLCAHASRHSCLPHLGTCACHRLCILLHLCMLLPCVGGMVPTRWYVQCGLVHGVGPGTRNRKGPPRPLPKAVIARRDKGSGPAARVSWVCSYYLSSTIVEVTRRQLDPSGKALLRLINQHERPLRYLPLSTRTAVAQATWHDPKRRARQKA